MSAVSIIGIQIAGCVSSRLSSRPPPPPPWKLIESTPPPTMMLAPPSTMWCAATAMAFRPEEQARLSVMPEVVTGRPASSAAARATLPDAATQPAITSSTSAGSTSARRTAWRMAWPSMVMLGVWLKPPRAALARPVRA